MVPVTQQTDAGSDLVFQHVATPGNVQIQDLTPRSPAARCNLRPKLPETDGRTHDAHDDTMATMNTLPNKLIVSIVSSCASCIGRGPSQLDMSTLDYTLTLFP